MERRRRRREDKVPNLNVIMVGINEKWQCNSSAWKIKNFLLSCLYSIYI